MEMSVSANDLSHKPGRRLSLLTGGQPPPGPNPLQAEKFLAELYKAIV